MGTTLELRLRVGDMDQEYRSESQNTANTGSQRSGIEQRTAAAEVDFADSMSLQSAPGAGNNFATGLMQGDTPIADGGGAADAWSGEFAALASADARARATVEERWFAMQRDLSAGDGDAWRRTHNELNLVLTDLEERYASLRAQANDTDQTSLTHLSNAFEHRFLAIVNLATFSGEPLGGALRRSVLHGGTLRSHLAETSSQMGDVSDAYLRIRRATDRTEAQRHTEGQTGNELLFLRHLLNGTAPTELQLLDEGLPFHPHAWAALYPDYSERAAITQNARAVAGLEDAGVSEAQLARARALVDQAEADLAAIRIVRRANPTGVNAIYTRVWSRYLEVLDTDADRQAFLESLEGRGLFDEAMTHLFDDATRVSLFYGTSFSSYANLLDAGANVMFESAQMAQTPEVDNQLYGHGAFMGAAPALMSDPVWSEILRALMPSVWETAYAAQGNSRELIPMFENNPVMAAYGMYITGQTRALSKCGRETDNPHHMAGMEWDVFFDPDLVNEWSQTSGISGMDFRPLDPSGAMSLAVSPALFLHETVADINMPGGSSRNPSEVIADLVNTMLIAHADKKDTIEQSIGMFDQYDDVAGSDLTAMGGRNAVGWMDTFARALQLAGTSGADDFATHLQEQADRPRQATDDAARDGSMHFYRGIQQAAQIASEQLGIDHLSVILDVKQKDITPELLGAVVEELNRRGVFVETVASFSPSQLQGVADMQQTVGTGQAPNAILFFHTAGGLQHACHEGEISPNQQVMFNAGFLLSAEEGMTGAALQQTYRVRELVVASLKEYQEAFGFSLGLYVQESDIDSVALSLLTDLANEESELFDLGFAWGGISGETASDIAPQGEEGAFGLGGQAALSDLTMGGAEDYSVFRRPTRGGS